MPERIRIEVAYAEPARQFLRQVELASGATIAAAIMASGLEREFAIDVSALTVGVWSRSATRETVLQDGDRVEVYRPLRIEPKDARRLRATRERKPRQP